MSELRLKSTGTIKLFESDNTSSVTIASPASLGADRTITLPDASVTLASGTMLATDGDGSSLTGLTAGQIPNLAASKITSGTMATARLGSGTASSSTVLYGDQTYKTEPSGGTNSPSFAAMLSGDQSFSADTWTKITCDTEISDTDGCYDNTTNYRFTPTTAGRYYVWSLFWMGVYTTYMYGTIRKNGSMVFNSTADASQGGGQNTNAVVDMNGSSDYVEFWSYVGTSANSFRTPSTLWGAFKIIE